MFRIRTRLVAGFLLVIVLPAIPLFLVVNNLLDRSLNPELHRQLEQGLTAGLAAARLGLAAEKQQFSAAVAALPDPADGNSGCIVLDRDGRPDPGATPPEVVPALLPDPGAPPVRAGSFLVLRKRTRGGVVTYARALPAELVDSAGAVTRALTLLRALQLERREILRSFVLPFVLVYGVLILVAVAVAVLVADRLARPIEALADGAGRVAAGDLDTRVAVRSRGEMGTLVGAFNDMVVRLAEQRSELVRLEKLAAWRGLARVLAHEIKNPLTPIQMAVQEARQSFEREDPRHGEILADCETIVLEEVAGLRNLVAGFSDFARLPEPHPRPGDFRGLAEDLDRLYGDHLRCELPDGPLPVLMDEGELRRALINLVDNGLAACAETGRPDVVILGARPASGGILEITVRDQGAGIPPENLERIFEPDFSTKKGGMGLGLPVVAGIVQGHGGTIAVDSQPGRGTTFTLTLSAAEEESCPAS